MYIIIHWSYDICCYFHLYICLSSEYECHTSVKYFSNPFHSVYVHCSSVIYLCNFDNRQFAVDCDAHTTKQGKYSLDRLVIINMEIIHWSQFMTNTVCLSISYGLSSCCSFTRNLILKPCCDLLRLGYTVFLSIVSHQAWYDMKCTF